MTRATAKVRSTSIVVARKPGCAPLKEMYRAAVVARPLSWNEVETGFVAAMEGFDGNVASGLADIGDLQNGKGDFFNDLLPYSGSQQIPSCTEIARIFHGNDERVSVESLRAGTEMIYKTLVEVAGRE